MVSGVNQRTSSNASGSVSPESENAEELCRLLRKMAGNPASLAQMVANGPVAARRYDRGQLGFEDARTSGACGAAEAASRFGLMFDRNHQFRIMTTMKEQAKMLTDHGLSDRLARREAVIGVIGLGYVGLPFATACAHAGFSTLGFDVDQGKIEDINSGRSYIDAVPSEDLVTLVAAARLSATGDFAALARCDVIAICVPTPLTRHREPDLTYVTTTAEAIASRLRTGQLVVLVNDFPGNDRRSVEAHLGAERILRAVPTSSRGFCPSERIPATPFFIRCPFPRSSRATAPSRPGLWKPSTAPSSGAW